MSFTDDDLKELKDQVIRCRTDVRRVSIRPDTAYHLICRLEAAEKLLIFSTYNKNESRLFQEWRKAAGK